MRCVGFPVSAPKSCSGKNVSSCLEIALRAWTPRAARMACPDTTLTLARVLGGLAAPSPEPHKCHTSRSPVHGKRR